MSDLGKDFEDEQDLGAEFDAEPEHDEEAHAEPATEEDVRHAQATTAPQTFAHRLVGNTPLGPQASAAIRALGSQLHGSPMSFGEDYRQARTEFDRDSDAGNKAHPTAGAFGSGVGLVNSLALPVGSGLKGAAGAGVLFGAGDAVDAASKGNTGEALATVPASVVASMALHGISAPVAKFLSEKLGGLAGRSAFKAAGPMLKDMRQVGVKGAEATGNRLLDKGAVHAFDTADSIANRLKPMAKATGEKLGNIRGLADRFGGQSDPGLIADQIESEVVAPLADSPALAGHAAEIQSYADRLRAMSRNGEPIPFGKLAGERINLDKVVDHAKRNASPGEQAWRDVRGILEEHEANDIHRASPTLADEYKAAKGDYAIEKPVAKMSSDMANRMAANHTVSLTDRLAGIATGSAAGGALGSGGDSDSGLIGGIVGGGAAGALAGHYGGALVARQLRTRGASTLAVAARGASRGLSRLASNPAVMGRFAPALERALSERGEQGMLALHHAMVERDPHYRAQFAQAQESEDPE